ncbi:DUF3887 domain-containing protein [[Clostridium] hylemonae]|uniref:DUF3887 domain-containing protein n=1 Tax=[Clostridium] hylemonae TaxID=89153 RepID=UPI001FCCA964|nr:DUF3887 domain-containing protein [[Clostridium] hylemonae]BDF03615.1 hypothetical protein CE91St63_06770 [[Clostridium] hylemonae]
MKKFFAALGVLLLVGGITGCSRSQELPDDFDENEVKKAAEEVIDLVNAGEYEKLTEEKWNAQLKTALPAEKMSEEIQPVIEELGAFESIENEAVAGGEDKDTEQEFAVVVVKAKYEERKVQFTISFDKNMKTAGFFIK